MAVRRGQGYARPVGTAPAMHRQPLARCRPPAKVSPQSRPSGHTLAERVMQAVRAEIRLGRMLPLGETEEDLRIAGTAAARVLRRAADSVPGARAVSCRLTPDRDTAGIKVTLTLAAALDRPLPERARHVRAAVLHAAHRTLGLQVGRLDLKIVDTLEPRERARHDDLLRHDDLRQERDTS
ncbi:hypothetical protein ABT112_25065 [Streptomyces sp. NPDC002055]|uniref:hypothetical protein n=1 Tax=Streptomyces sp. NPDC002055 TaxID=3154534 RepID=UPI00331E61DD